MLHAGLDLSRRRLDFCLLDEAGERVWEGATPPDVDGLDGFARGVDRRFGTVGVRAAIESMTGARFVHDTLERCGWEVEVADAIKVKGLAPLACKTDRIDAWVLAELSRRDLVPAIWLPDFEQRAERERARWRLHLVKHRSALKQRVHAQLMTFGHACPVSDLFGVAGRELLERLAFPDPWRTDVLAAVSLIDDRGCPTFCVRPRLVRVSRGVGLRSGSSGLVVRLSSGRGFSRRSGRGGSRGR
jgi:transposase